MKTTYLLPLTLAAIGIAIAGLGYRTNRRHGYGPVLVGIFAATVMLVGKFLMYSNAMMYGGGGLLIVASIWNSWPRKNLTSDLVELERGPASSRQPAGNVQSVASQKSS